MPARRPEADPGQEPAGPEPSPWRPFRSVTFDVIWTATVVSNVGAWMYNAACGWLMTSLSPDPLIVSLVQVATNLPMLLLALPAGALADVVDRRRLLIFAELVATVITAVFAAFVSHGLVTPGLLLLFTFLVSAGGVLVAPAWQAVVPQLVPKRDLPAAVTVNSVGFNISRAIGPALGGAAIVAFGIAAPFWVNAVSNLAVVGALLWWRTAARSTGQLPAEHFIDAIVTGVRYGRNNLHLRATMVRAVGFFLFGSTYWALLPLIAREQIAEGPELYGVLLGAIGGGAIVGAFLLPRLKVMLGPNRAVAAAMLGTAVALVLFGVAKDAATGLLASVIAGASWIIALASLNVSAQVALPEWVRGRGLSLYMTVMFGALTLGSIMWGQVASRVGLPLAHFLAAAGMLAAIPLTWRWKLQTGAQLDLTPSLHWPVPMVSHEIENDRGPVLVSVEDLIDPKDRDAFLAAVGRLAHERRRDGAYTWSVFEDVTDESRFVETFMVGSWLDHLRQHQRVTNADRVSQDEASRFHTAGVPKVAHLISVPRDGIRVNRPGRLAR